MMNMTIIIVYTLQVFIYIVFNTDEYFFFFFFLILYLNIGPLV